jgi:hypothetical protein
MNMIPDDIWSRVLPLVRNRCPRLTEQDIAEAQQRVDLLTAKIQNRHWCDRITARRTVLQLLQECGVSLTSPS